MENIQVQNKFKILFQKILEPNYVMNNYYVDGLINKLSNNGDPELSFLDQKTLMADLLIDALLSIKEAHITVKVFVIRMLAIVAKKELDFMKTMCRRSEIVLEEFSQINSPDMNPSLKVAYLEFAHGLLNHNSGISWILETGVWKEILNLTTEKKTVFIVRQTYKFASRFLWRLNDTADENNLKEVLSHIVKPFCDIDFLRIDSLSAEQEVEIVKLLEPLLHIVLIVLEDGDMTHQPTILVSILLNDFKIIPHILITLEWLRQEDVLLLASKVIYSLMLSKLFLTKRNVPDNLYMLSDFTDLGVMYFNTIQRFIQRRSATLVLDFCNASNMIWVRTWKGDSLTVTREHNGPNVQAQNEILFLSLIPCLVFVKFKNTHTAAPVGSVLPNERITELTMKFLDITTEHTARAAYALRDLTLELNTLSVTLQSVKRLTSIKSHFNIEQANLVFQVFFYVLKEYDPTKEDSDSQPDYYEDTQEKILVMTYVLETLHFLVKNHNIRWHESLEVLCLYNVVYNILKRPNLSCKFVVTALNLIAVTVRKFLPPNLSLLMETTPGSEMNDLGKLIYMKMHELNWEIRDTALELLLVCTEISFIKFPSLQKQIIENKLINVAMAIAINDHQFYVQASALRCIGAASKICTVWEQLKIQYPDVQDILITMMSSNEEGVVRKEACSVLCELYQNHKLCPNFTAKLYEHMIASALSDFYWEVQLCALRFWRQVIQNELTAQGMLDGTFPPVTFSKETRKIVKLNDTEIQKRLTKALDELASIGCLTVLVKLLDEDTEIEIMEAALTIAQELVDILNKYRIRDTIQPNQGDIIQLVDVKFEIEDQKSDIHIKEEINDEEMPVSADNVIDGIIKADDMNLLSSIYESQMNLQGGGESQAPLAPAIKISKKVSPFLFVKHLGSNNFKAIVEEKKKWKEGIRSISSLLDDVLGIYEINDEVNALDCY